jgi:hypothetical protein
VIYFVGKNPINSDYVCCSLVNVKSYGIKGLLFMGVAIIFPSTYTKNANLYVYAKLCRPYSIRRRSDIQLNIQFSSVTLDRSNRLPTVTPSNPNMLNLSDDTNNLQNLRLGHYYTYK